jgi:hypothetical protein
MKTIIAGTRDIKNPKHLLEAIRLAEQNGIYLDEIVSGMAVGPDYMGYRYGLAKGIPVKPFPADWIRFGKAAGPIRNQKMAEYANALIAIWDGKSTGTHDMIERAKACGLKIFVYKV